MTCPAASNRDRLNGYPISRWYAIPVCRRMARWLSHTPVRPSHITLLGLVPGLAAAAVLFANPVGSPLAAVFVLAAWLMDRTDGLLARCQNSTSPFGAWLDANVDELHEVAWHAGAAYAAASIGGSQVPWFLLIAFLAGKYLLMTGLAEERSLSSNTDANPADNVDNTNRGWMRALYHLPGNADVRLHLLIVGLATGLMTVELAIIAVYYNLRWIARFGLTARRLEGCR